MYLGIWHDKISQSLRQLISEQTGLNIREGDEKTLTGTILSRMKSLGLSSPDEYYDFLRSDGAWVEWQEIVKRLTTGETYFFRDGGQFSLLRLSILPELIERNKEKRTLRIWSAGCSTGEEAYSLAILIDEMNHPSPQSSPTEGRGGLKVPSPLAGEGQGGGIPPLKGWDIVIIGTDISEDAITKGRRGCYGDWSFRKVNEEVRGRYFRKVKNEWLLDQRIRDMVRLDVMNLIIDRYPDYGKALHDMDLILCRNVFIYFNPDVVSKIVARLTNTLSEGGYLMTGHAELRQQSLPSLKTKVFPESVVYQKSAELGVRSEELKPVGWAVPTILESGLPKHPIPSPTLPLKGREIFPLPQGVETQNLASLQGKGELKEARVLADRGRYDEAAGYCREAIKADPFNAAPYYLLAQIAREKGDKGAEMDMMKRVIYLNPSHIAAYLELGVIYENDGDTVRALKMRTTALELLKALPPDASVEPYTFTAVELIEHVEKMMKM